MANSVDPVCSGSMLFASILDSTVMLGSYLQQTTLADDIFRCIFLLGTLRVKILGPTIPKGGSFAIFHLQKSPLVAE